MMDFLENIDLREDRTGSAEDVAKAVGSLLAVPRRGWEEVGCIVEPRVPKPQDHRCREEAEERYGAQDGGGGLRWRVAQTEPLLRITVPDFDAPAPRSVGEQVGDRTCHVGAEVNSPGNAAVVLTHDDDAQQSCSGDSIPLRDTGFVRDGRRDPAAIVGYRGPRDLGIACEGRRTGQPVTTLARTPAMA